MENTYKGETAIQKDSGRWHWNNCSYGSWESFTRSVDQQRNRPDVTRQVWRGWDITIKTYGLCDDPLLRYKTTYHVRGIDMISIRAAKAFIDHKQGPDVVSLALDNIKQPPQRANDIPIYSPPTEAQQRRLYQIAGDILESDGLGINHMHKYEFKNFYLTHGYRGKLFLITEVGRKCDEGTLAAIACRTRRHIYMGVRGGLESLVGTKRYIKRLNAILIWGKET